MGAPFEVGERVGPRQHHQRACGAGRAAERFLADVERQDPQLVMAKVTGSYRHGNERTAATHPRNQR